MEARFIGDPSNEGDGPAKITVFGVDFVFNQWRKVDDLRFARHSHFETREGRKGQAGALDHDFDGEKGGAVPADLGEMTVPQLKALAEKLAIDLGDATKKADIIAAIELAHEASAQAASSSETE